MRVLGVDPGLTRCGVGVVDGTPGRKVALVDVGVIRSDAQMPHAARLVHLETELEGWFDRTTPELVAIERVYADSNITNVMGTAHATAVAMLVAERRGIPVGMHTPTEVKAAVSGNGRADKAQVTTMVTRLLSLDTPPRPADAADALALAICHLWKQSTAGRYAAAVVAHGATRRGESPLQRKAREQLARQGGGPRRAPTTTTRSRGARP